MKKVSRRRFLRESAAAAAALGFPYIVSPSALGAAGTAAPSSRITIGCVGTGARGRSLLRSLLNEDKAQVVAVCDVDADKRDQARERVESHYSESGRDGSYRGCAFYGDYRELLGRSDIDAVVIATPDHWHAINVCEAASAGKDIYCEKPMSLTVTEARAMVRAVRTHQRVFQTGSQQRSAFEFRHACELVRNGYIGQLEKIQADIALEGWPMCSRECELGSEPVPAELDWDMWLGPAPVRPYHSEIAPPATVRGFPHWRYFRDYSGGLMTDWGAHGFDIIQWALGMDQSGPVEVIPPAQGTGGTLIYVYANGIEVRRESFGGGLGLLFTGTEGSVEIHRGSIKTKPASLVRKVIGPNDVQLYRSSNHYSDWLSAICTRSRPVADVEAGCRSVTVCHIGNIATQLGRTLSWDPAAEKFVNDAEADKMLRRTTRSPWHL